MLFACSTVVDCKVRKKRGKQKKKRKKYANFAQNFCKHWQTIMNNISSESPFFFDILNEYKRTKNFNSSRIKQDLTKEDSTSKDYKGREIYELLQNAEDEKSTHVLIKLNSENRLLSVANGGKDCTPFTEKGFCSIMMAEMSPKFESRETFIGCKGLGFRSLLNWAEKIRIHSNGVCCTFSRSIAKKYWEEIKQNLTDENVKRHEDFAKEKFGLDCPVSMLSIPYVEDKPMSDDYTTKIEVVYKDECQKSILEQIRSLTGKVLLFLSNIQKIDIQIDNQSWTLRKEEEENDARHIRIYDLANPDGKDFTTYKINGLYEPEHKKYEVCIAYDEKQHEPGKYVYTFFPTKVRIGLPCVIHATFDLNSSRNAINESDANNWMQSVIAKALKDFAEQLANGSKSVTWEYYDLLNLNPYDQQEFPIMYEELQGTKETARVYPTVLDRYKMLCETLHYSEAMSDYVEKTSPKAFAHHLIKGFTEKKLCEQNADRFFIDEITRLSREIQDSAADKNEQLRQRADFICAVSTVRGCKPMPLLTDISGQLIHGNAKINVGESIPYLPKDMDIAYVDDALVEQLADRFNLTGGKIQRSITQLLKQNNCADVSDMDLNAVKQSIVSYTKNKMTLDGFRQLMFALFDKLLLHEDSSSLREIFLDFDFHVFAADGYRRFPSQVVLSSNVESYPDRWRLADSLQEWTAFFQERTDQAFTGEDVIDFFVSTIGVSRVIPMDYQDLGEKANEYLNKFSTTLRNPITSEWYYYTSSIEDKQKGFYNRFHFVDTDYLKHLQDAGYRLSKIIKLIMSDERTMSELKRTTLHYYFRNLKSEDVSVSYPLYELRKSDLFARLSTYVVADNLNLSADKELEKELELLSEDNSTKQILIMLGAKERISDLSLQELYAILTNLPEKKLTKGVQQLYKSIREAINGKRGQEEFQKCAEGFKLHGSVYARKAGGGLEIKPVSEVYYWDNEQLPHHILSQKYKIELPTRVGEDSVKAIFGVTLAKEIELKREKYVENEVLTEEINKRIKELRRYILAYRLQNSREIKSEKGRMDLASNLKNISIVVYSSCSFSNDGMSMPLSEGDMVSTKHLGVQTFHVCANLPDIETAIKSPSFCENITEAICITLQVTSSEMANCFRSILKNSASENEFVSNKEIGVDIWNDVDKMLGLTDEEKKFWQQIAASTRREIDTNKLSTDYKEKTIYLKSLFPDIALPTTVRDFSDMLDADKYALLMSLRKYGVESADILGSNGLCSYYKSKLEQYVTLYKDAFAHLIHQLVTEKSHLFSTPYQYYDECQCFTMGQWLDDTIKGVACQLLSEEKLHELFLEALKKKFSFIKDLDPTDKWRSQIGISYKKMIEEAHLTSANIDQRELALTFFEGYEDEFRQILRKYVPQHATQSEPSSGEKKNDLSDIRLEYGIGVNKTTGKTNERKNTRGHGGRYTSDREKFRSGLQAEEMVFGMLANDTQHYANVKGCSRNLDPTNGNDHLHYDIIYSTVDEDGNISEQRKLEVKSMADNTILLSKDEYDEALRDCENYDLAIVQGNHVWLLSSPFSSANGNTPLAVTPDNYRITMDIMKKK